MSKVRGHFTCDRFLEIRLCHPLLCVSLDYQRVELLHIGAQSLEAKTTDHWTATNWFKYANSKRDIS